MATVRLGRYESREGDLPPVCMRCGRPACVYRRHVLIHRPGWFYAVIFLTIVTFPLGLILYFVAAWLAEKRLRVRAPLCPQHRFHWLGRFATLWLAICIWFVLLMLTLASMPNFEGSPLLPQRTGLILFPLTCGVGPFAFLGLLLLLNLTAIRPTRMDQHSVTLTGVSTEFVEAHRVHIGLPATEAPWPYPTPSAGDKA